MKPSLILSLIIFFLLSEMSVARSQDSVQKDVAIKYTAYKAGVGALFFYEPAVTFAVEKRKGRYAGQLRLDCIIPSSHTINDQVNNTMPGKMLYYGYALRAEPRIYNKGSRKPGRDRYIGMDILYAKIHSLGAGQYADALRSGNRYYDEYIVVANMIGSSVTFSLQRRLGKHLLLSYDFTAGWKLRFIQNYGRYNDDDIDTYRHLHVTYNPGVSFAPSVTASLSVGLRK